ncbi:MAG: ABC transporter permease [Candidatus Aminicenantes bacterium]|nr:ABC transporter permease [Candidatus Aminicenantes bacterium]
MNLGAVVKKEFIQIRRDPLILFMLVFFPTILLLFFGYVLSFDVRNVRLGVLDEDATDPSRAFVQMLTSGESFRLETVFSSRGEIDTALDDGSVLVALVIPRGFSETLEQGGTAAVQGLIDGSDGRKAGIAQGYLQAYTTAFSQRMIGEWAVRTGKRVVVPVTPEGRIWYNPELKSTLYLIAGLIVFIFMITGTISTSLSVVRERERGTMEQLLVSPLNAGTVIVGKTLPYLGISAVSTVIILIAGRFAFGVTIKGSIPLLALASLLFLLAALGQGILISTVTSSQQVAYFVAALSSILPALLLSDFVFPISGMPRVIQAVTFVVPARYFVHLLRGIMMRGAGFGAGFGDLAALAIFSGFTLLAAAARLKKTRLV